MAAAMSESRFMASSFAPFVAPSPSSYDASYKCDSAATNPAMELAEQLEQLHPASFAWALGCCDRDRAEAEEVLQNVYVKVLEGKARFNGRSTLKTWLFA